MYYKKQILIFLCCLVGSLVKGQDLSPEVTQYNPVSPNSASLGKFGTFPVNHNLGTVNVGVPLYTLDTGKQQLPIALSYHTGGIKVNDLAPWVGLGWTLNAGGAIIRNVKSKPDNLLVQEIIDLENAVFDSINFNYIYKSWEGTMDSQPDEFIINAPGISGTFQFDPNQGGMVVFDGREIARVSVNGVDQMEVIGPDGTKMIFGKSIIEENNQFHDATESSWHSPAVQANGFEYISTWYLTEMIAPKAKDTIRFRYTDNINHDFPEATGEYTEDASMVSQILGTYPDIQQITQKVLTRIEAENGYVLFDFDTIQRTDLVGEPKLNSIQVFNEAYGTANPNQINEFGFNYSYFQRQGGLFPSGNSSGVIYDKGPSRTSSLRLDSVDIGINGVGGSYYFVYNSTALPQRGTTAQDQWGYANTNLGSLMPRTAGMYFPSEVPARSYDVGNGDRAADASKMKAASLEKIIHPTGGETVFELEANEVQRTIDGSSTLIRRSPEAMAYGPGCESYGGSYKEVTFTVDGILIGTQKLSMTFSGATQTNGTTTRVEFNGQTYYPSSQTGTDFETIVVNPTLNSGSTYTLKIYDYREGEGEGTYDCAHTTASVEWAIQGPNETEVITEYMGGLRVKSIKNYDGISQEPITQKYFEYSTPNILRPFRSQAYRKVYLTPLFEIRLKLSTEEYFSNNLGNRPVVEYGTVTEYALDNQGNESGKIVYDYNTISPQRILDSGMNGLVPFKHSQNPGDFNNLFYGLKDVLQDDDFTYYRSDGWQYGTLAHKYVYKNTGTFSSPIYTLLQQTDNTYENMAELDIKSNYIFANIANPNRLSMGLYSNSFDTPYDQSNDEASFVFSYYVAKKSTGKKVLKTSTVTNYDETGSNGVATHTEYFYDNTDHLLPTRTVTTDSRDKTFITKTYYPDDVASTSSLIGPDLTTVEKQAVDDLKTTGTSHRIAEPIQVEAYQDKDKDGVADSDEVLGISRTNFKDWDSSSEIDLVLPTGVMTLKGEYNPAGNPMESRIVYHEYDALGNPIDVSRVDGPHTYYVWGYQGQYPIAKIENLETGDITPGIQNLMDAAVAASNSDNDTCLDSGNCNEKNLRVQLDSLRNGLPSKALMTSYTYDVLVGVSSSTDPKGYTMYYEYDTFNRLKAVKDDEGNFIEDYEYHYVTE